MFYIVVLQVETETSKLAFIIQFVYMSLSYVFVIFWLHFFSCLSRCFIREVSAVLIT